MVYAQAPQGHAMPAPSGRPRRPLWHWLLLAGVAAVGLLVVAALAIVITVQLLTRGNPQTTLEDYYTALADSDCELFMESTTEEFREAAELTSCTAFEETLGSVGEIDYAVDDRINRQGYAIFEVTESYSENGQSAEVELHFYVRRIDGQWDLDGFEVIQVDEGTEPIT